MNRDTQAAATSAGGDNGSAGEARGGTPSDSTVVCPRCNGTGRERSKEHTTRAPCCGCGGSGRADDQPAAQGQDDDAWVYTTGAVDPNDPLVAWPRWREALEKIERMSQPFGERGRCEYGSLREASEIARKALNV